MKFVALACLVFGAWARAQEIPLSPTIYEAKDAEGNYWGTITKGRLLTTEERDKIRALGTLPAHQAVRRLALLISSGYNPNDEARELARQTFLSVKGWQEEMSRLLAEAAARKTPEQVYGADFERRRMLRQLSPEEEKASDALLGGLVGVRLRQMELFSILRSLQSPEAVPIVAPYLFDDTKRLRSPSDPFGPVTNNVSEFVCYALVALVPDLPKRGAPFESEEAYIRALRQWWLANAHRYGADPHFRPAPLANSTAYADTPLPPATPPAAASPATPTAVQSKPLSVQRPVFLAILLVALLALLVGLQSVWKRRR